MFYAILYLSNPLTSVQNFTEIVQGEPLRLGLNARGVAKQRFLTCRRLYLRKDARYSLGYH